ncbi:hypothetical protein ZWY2020_009664 [Hordeum vulgare]|nr:hypothetical protein ZWY2020_009664 [Hordeum vulgare]
MTVSRRQRAKMSLETIRNQCRDVAKMLHGDGGTTDTSPLVALAKVFPLADALVVAHPRSTVALNLAGDLHSMFSSELFKLGSNAQHQDVLRQSRQHSVLALAYFTEARRLAPRCIVTPVSRGNELMCLAKLGDIEQEVLPEIRLPFATEVLSVVFLHANGMTDCIADVQKEFVRASTMIDPDDPAKHHVWYDILRRTKHGNRHRQTKHANPKLDWLEHGYQLIHSSPKDNIAKARAEAKENLQKIMEFVCDQLVPAKVREILVEVATGDFAAAREEARKLSATYGYCARARMLAGYVDLHYIISVDGPQRLAMLRELIGMLHEASADFRRSIIIAKFLAEIYSSVDQDESAAAIIRRALGIHNPDDPGEHDVPVGCTPGDCREGRTSDVQQQLSKMLANIEAKQRPSHPTDILPSKEDITLVDDEDTPTNGKGKKKKVNKRTPVHYAFKYSQNKEIRQNMLQKMSRIAEWEEWLQKNKPSAKPVVHIPLHALAGGKSDSYFNFKVPWEGGVR